MCIFVSKPRECIGACYDEKKLVCLLNHQFFLLSDSGKVDMRRVLEAEMSASRRTRVLPRVPGVGSGGVGRVS